MSDELKQLKELLLEDGEDGVPTVMGVLEGTIHQAFTVTADDLRMQGVLTQEERIFLSSAIGDALETFCNKVKENMDLYTRELVDDTEDWDYEDDEPEEPMDEPEIEMALPDEDEFDYDRYEDDWDEDDYLFGEAYTDSERKRDERMQKRGYEKHGSGYVSSPVHQHHGATYHSYVKHNKDGSKKHVTVYSGGKSGGGHETHHYDKEGNDVTSHKGKHLTDDQYRKKYGHSRPSAAGGN